VTLRRQLLQSPWFIDLMSAVLFWNMRRRSQIRKVLLQVYKDPTAVTERLVEEIYQPAFDQGALGVFASVFKSPPGRKLDQLLVTLNRPLFLLWGEADPWMPPEKATQFQVHYPQATLQLVDAGHCPHDERPEVVNDAIDQWVMAQCSSLASTEVPI
jgi:pimeloyl-ACP methyl ester carboxylesterase